MSMRSRIIGAAVFIVLACVVPSEVAAWGDEGHRIVARIAARLLDEPARRAVVTLLAQPTPEPYFDTCQTHQRLPLATAADKLACIATWADAVRNETGHDATAEDHFVNIPITAPGYDSKYCARGCVVTAIARSRARLLDPATPLEKRREALKFIVHFVGDLHQPLHTAIDLDRDLTADDNAAKHLDDGQGDRGGNRKIATWLGQEATQFGCWNLHAIWDAGLIEQTGGKDHAYASRLLKRLTPARRKRLEAGDPIAWVNEAFKLAGAHAYEDLTPPNGDPADLVCQIDDEHAKKCVAYDQVACARVEVHRRYHLGQTYYEKNRQIVDGQLTAAGVRLARLLRETLR